MTSNALVVLKGLDLSIFCNVLDDLDDQMPNGDRPNEKFGLTSLHVSEEAVRVLAVA